MGLCRLNETTYWRASHRAGTENHLDTLHRHFSLPLSWHQPYISSEAEVSGVKKHNFSVLRQRQGGHLLHRRGIFLLRGTALNCLASLIKLTWQGGGPLQGSRSDIKPKGGVRWVVEGKIQYESYSLKCFASALFLPLFSLPKQNILFHWNLSFQVIVHRRGLQKTQTPYRMGWPSHISSSLSSN